jgi:glycosyltransferase involved in cell wall biosynthesis
MSKQVGIYRRVFPLVSETFIEQQAAHLKQFQPTFIAGYLTSITSFSHVSLNQQNFPKLNQFLHLLTCSPAFYSNSFEQLQKLNLIHAHFGTDGIYAMNLAEKLKIPFLVTFHGYDITVTRQMAWRTGKFLYYQLILHQEELKKKAAAFIAVSHFIRRKLLEQNYPPEKIVQHYIGVDTAKFTPIAKKPDRRYLLCVGRHTEKKGIDTLLTAFARIARKYPDVSLIQVGAGSLTAKLKALARTHGIEDRVWFLGNQPHESVLHLMQGAEIFVLPSQTARNGDAEALGIVFNEASACGIPVVSTLHGGIPEAVLEGETGFLVPERDDLALAGKLDILLSDRALGEQMGRNGREWVCDTFDIQRQTAQLEAIYESFG